MIISYKDLKPKFKKYAKEGKEKTVKLYDKVRNSKPVFLAVNKLQDLEYNTIYKIMKKKYPDYEDDEYNAGPLKFVWGIHSWDDFSAKDLPTSIYTMNDIDICFNRSTKTYILGIETAYIFESHKDAAEYFLELLNKFSEYMDKENLNKDYKISTFCMNFEEGFEAESIEELYAKYKIFALGFNAAYASSEKTTNKGE